MPVDNLQVFIHNNDELSTSSVDNLPNLWKTIYEFSYMEYVDE